MQTVEKIALAMIVGSYVIYILFAASSIQIFAESDYFLVGDQIQILGHVIDVEPWQWIGWCLFFFLNSFCAQSNYLIIAPIFQRIVYGSDSKPPYSNRKLFMCLLVYDIWIGVYTFLRIIGVFSNVLFLLSTIVGHMIADIYWKYMYICDPEAVRYQHINTNIQPNV